MIDKKTVEYIAELARLEVSAGEKEMFTKELNAVLDYIEFLNTAPTDGIEPAETNIFDYNPMREDTVQESLPVEKTLKNGSNIKNGFFAVPKIIG
jgi:aspartyl-tRNA(Asn)/glutamyl-tRNA(Gln) amidotransferase subunit C